MIRQRLSLPLPPLFLSFTCWVRGSSVALNICISSTEPCWPLEGLQNIPVSSWWEKSFYQLLGKIQKPWSRKITPSNQSTSIICQLRWKSQTVCWICITSPQRGRWTKRTGASYLYVLLLINMWSVCGQWRRGFTRTIKTDATFYLLNGREAERVALDRRRRRALLACNDVLPPSRLLWWQARLSLFFLADVGGGREAFLFPKQPLFVPLWIREAEVVRRRRKPDFWC